MMLTKTIDWLLIGTRYLGWALGAVGIAASALLFVLNLSMGLYAAATFIAAFLLSVGVFLLLLPEVFAQGPLEGKLKYKIGAAALVLATAIMGIVYFSNGRFPALNLIFMQV